MGLPFEPESEESLKERFSEAISQVYPNGDIEWVDHRPGQLRKHVFDYPDGMRLIISRDQTEDGKTFLHVSVSSHDEINLTGKELLENIVKRVNHLRGVVPGAIRAFASEDGIIHLLFPDSPNQEFEMPPFPGSFWN